MKKTSILIWIFITAILVFYFVYLPIITRYRDLKSEEERISAELIVLDEKIRALEEERDLLKNDAEYVEKVIRNEFGLVKPGEVIYKFIPKEEFAKKRQAAEPVTLETEP